VQQLCHYLRELGLPAAAAASTNLDSSSTSSSSSSGASPGAKGPALHKLLQQGNALEGALQHAIQGSVLAAGVDTKRRSATTDAAAEQSYLQQRKDEVLNTERQLRLEAARKVTPQLLLQMKQFGEAVAAQLPLRFCCNSPRCMNTSKLSELQLVRKPGSVCPHCKVARWCSKACLNEHWQQHLPVFKRLFPRAKREKGAAAAAAAPAGVQATVP
jgi:hypothetical protein